MALIRNKKTGQLITCSQSEATILSDPILFKEWVDAMLKEKKYNQSIDLFANIDTKMVYRLQDHDLVVMDILDGCLEQVPDTETSRILYSSKK